MTGPMRRGRCEVCGVEVAVTRALTARPHRVYVGTHRNGKRVFTHFPCTGGGRPVLPLLGPESAGGMEP